MNDVTAWCVVRALVAAGAAADAFLAWMFISDWRQRRSEERARSRVRWSFPSAATNSPGSPPRVQALAGLVAISMSGGAATAQEPVTPPASGSSGAITAEQQEPPPAPAEQPTTSETPNDAIGAAIRVQLNLDYTSAYFYRGIIQEDSGLILQPAARLTSTLIETEALTLDGFIGAWNSFHGQRTGADTSGNFTEYWYEADLYAGLTATTGALSLTASYTFLTSPADSFETVQELGFALALDDSAWLKEWALKPSATIAIETGADASDGADSDTGIYLELGIAPGFSLDVGATPVTFAFPTSVGLSFSDYYQDARGNDDTFGFAQTGARVWIPLGDPGRLGAWTLNMGVAVLFLGDHTQTYNGGDEAEIIGTVGVQWNF